MRKEVELSSFLTLSSKRKDSKEAWFQLYRKALHALEPGIPEEEKLKSLDFVLHHRSFDPVEALIYPAQKGYTWLVRYLLKDKRIDPLAENSEAFIMACIEGHMGCVELFIQDEHIDVSVGNNEGLFKAVHHGHLELMKLLLKQDKVTHTNEERGSIFSVACRNGHLEIIKFLMAFDDFSKLYDIEIQNTARTGRLEVLNLLLEDPRADPSSRYTLIIALKNQYYDLVTRLLYDKRTVLALSNNKPLFYQLVHTEDKNLSWHALALLSKRIFAANPLFSAGFFGHFKTNDYQDPVPEVFPCSFFRELFKYAVLLEEQEDEPLRLNSLISG